MRLDFVTIFPEFFTALDVSLLGKARQAELVQLGIHNLRDWAAVKEDGTPNPHKTVDDAPYGGGAGMVMKADVWGRALDDLLTEDAVLILPSPAGQLFSQSLAKDLAQESHLVFACGRYEGIDGRVPEYYASKGVRVLELSIGDYVLNGGEVAAFAMTEAITRLIPGFMSNAESLVEESHENGLLEYASYTRPATWRGLDVPEILLGGHHAKIMEWRHQQQVERTRERRPDLLGPEQN